MHINKSGFTLIEMLIVIMVLGIVLSITVPVMSTILYNSELKETADELVQDIKEVQNLSVTEGTDYMIRINTKNKYYILKKNDAFAGSIKKVQLSSKVKEISCDFINKSDGIYVLSFNCLGVPYRPGTITLTSWTGKVIRITVMFVTGRVRLYEGSS